MPRSSRTALSHRIFAERRRFLRIGSLAPLGLSLPALLAADEDRRVVPAADDARIASNHLPTSSFGRAKRCLILFMWGGPAHQDLWDMKPDAPDSVRGEFQPISTSVPGLHVCEHLEYLSKQMDKLALVRSVTHTDNNHSTSAHWMLTGHKHRLSAENLGASNTDFPHIGSVVTRMKPPLSGLPSFVALPERIATTSGAVVPGQNGGRLGALYDPFTIDEHPDEADFEVGALALPADVSLERLHQRQQLLQTLNARRSPLNQAASVGAMQTYYQRAADLVASPQVRLAFDLHREPAAIREQYGMKTFGQSALLGRRLLEAGVRLVTVYWHREMPGVDTTWDTHGQNFQQLKDRLIPQVDQPIAALLQDLQQRGMLEDTLIVWLSEFGRTPRINKNAGRDHWGPCNTIWMAGGGVQGGLVHGASDKQAAYPERDPVSPADVSATVFHALGIDPHTLVYDRENRPHTIANGRPLELF